MFAEPGFGLDGTDNMLKEKGISGEIDRDRV
jgi:hypothetical protein